MALKKYRVKEGYVFLHLNNLGQFMKRTPAGGIVELPSIDHYQQPHKLEEVKPEEKVPDVPNDLALIEGVKGNEKLLEFFEEEGLTTYRQIAELEPEKLTEVRGVKMDKAKKIIASAFQLAGLE